MMSSKSNEVLRVVVRGLVLAPLAGALLGFTVATISLWQEDQFLALFMAGPAGALIGSIVGLLNGLILSWPLREKTLVELGVYILGGAFVFSVSASLFTRHVDPIGTLVVGVLGCWTGAMLLFLRNLNGESIHDE